MNGEVEQGIERFGGVLEERPRPTPGCSAIEEEEEKEITRQHTLSVGLLSTSDRLVAEAATYKAHTYINKRQTFMPSAGF
jgi:hypothetical protein